MGRSIVCLIGCALNIFMLTFWLIIFWGFSFFESCIVAKANWFLGADLVLIVLCLVIGNGIFKLNLECLFLKYDRVDITVAERIVFASVGFFALAVVLVGFANAIKYNISAEKEPMSALLRYHYIPVLGLGNAVMGLGCYLAHQYYQIIK